MTAQPTASFCHLCGRPISGRYYRYTNGLVVCAACEARSPRCARCNTPVGANTPGIRTSDGRTIRLCRSCEREAVRCAGCGDPILTHWYMFEELPQAASEQRRFCPRCVQTRSRCDLCHAPCASPPTTLPDGQYRCALCATDMALGESEIRAIYADAVALFRSIVGELREPPPLQVVGRREMGETRRRYTSEAQQAREINKALQKNQGSQANQAQQAGASGRVTAGPIRVAPPQTAPQQEVKPGHSGQNGAGSKSDQAITEDAVSHHVLGYFVRSHGVTTIYVEMGLTRGMLLGTLTHELAHAWQTERLGRDTERLDLVISEGFAEWVAYHALLARGLTALANRAPLRDDLYGRGLRHFLAISQSQGRSAVLRAALAV